MPVTPPPVDARPARAVRARQPRPALAADASRAAAATVPIPIGPVGSVEEMVASHREADSAELFGIADLSAAFGITPRTIRFYEDQGLLAPRRVNGARIYTRRDRARLGLILRSKAIGASLAEIRHVLDLYGDHGEGRERQLSYVLERTDAAIRELEQKRAHIEATLAELRHINQEVRLHLQRR